ncbi:MAG: transporter substrate-binding domain-containing protein [Pseudomonadota bacterium]
MVISKPLRALSFVIAICAACPAVAEERLTVVSDEWPPFSGRALPNQGISPDVIKAVLEHAGYDVAVEILPWARIMDGAREGEYDIVGSLFFDPDIAEYMTYGDPFYRTSIKFVQQTGSTHTVHTLAALKPYSIAVGDGFLYESKFDRATDLNKVLVTTTLQGVQMVAAGRVDLTLDSEEVVEFALQNEAPEIADAVEIMPHVLAQHDIHMAVRNTLPNKDKVISDFNRVLAEMKADGRLDALLSKHR